MLDFQVSAYYTSSMSYEVYILHFDKPYWNNCKHYVGYSSKGTLARVAKHMDGKGSLLVNYAYNVKGIDFTIAHIETVDYLGAPFDKLTAMIRERELKREKNLSRHCPICQKEKKG